MRNKLLILGAFVSGILIGVITYDRVISGAFASHRQVIVTLASAEEELRSSREERKGNHLVALFHRWNAVHLRSKGELCALSDEMYTEMENTWFSPVTLLMLEGIANESDPNVEKGKNIIEAIQRGHLAHQLESLGFSKLAAQEWEKAEKQSELTLVEIKSHVNDSRESFNDEISIKAEEAVLGPDI